MREYAISLEEQRLDGIDDIEDYPWFYERHRVFPEIFETRHHAKILDSSGGVGCVAKRILDNYSADLVCNDISPTCLRILKKLGISTVSFDLDNKEQSYPFSDSHFDAIISLVTIEHLMNPDHFLKETKRILVTNGYLYLTTPNYAALCYVLQLVFRGRSFHNPLSDDKLANYEFYAHVRYFTYRTLLEYVSSFGFTPDTVYLALPKNSSRYKALCSSSKPKALVHRYGRWLMYHLMSPRWAAEPIICFQKSKKKRAHKIRKIVL